MIQPNGSKLWRLAYRYGGKQKLLSFGRYPETSLQAARNSRDDAKRLLAGGLDPSLERKNEKRARKIAKSNTFESIAAECLERWEKEGNAPVTLMKKRWLLSLVPPQLGKRPIIEITAVELLEDVLRKIEKTGRHDTAIRVRGVVGRVFRHAIATGRAERDITRDLQGALITPKVRHHPAITSPAKIGELLRAIDGFNGYVTTQIALKLAPLLFLRPGELRMAEWVEIDTREKVLRISAHKTKLRRDHIVPLSIQALALIDELRVHSGHSRYLFPSLRSLKLPMSENTINAALRRLGYSSDEMTAHGFRSMASTRLNESGNFAPDVIERQLAHLEQNEVRRAYNAAEHLPERIRMMQYWASYLDTLRKTDI